MALINRKISTYAKDVSNLSNTPNDDGITAAELKAIFMGAAKEEIKTSVNGIVDDLVATTDGASGADQIGMTPIDGLTGDTPQTVIEDLNSKVVKKTGDQAIVGSISVTGGSFRSTTGITNLNSTDNCMVTTGNLGVEISRNIPDSRPALIVNQKNAGSTGDILDLRVAGENLVRVDYSGVAEFSKSPTVPTPTTNTQAANKSYVDGHSDMLKSTYDTNNDGVVDNAKKVNNLTVETAVPQNAVFTDTTYSPATQSVDGLMSSEDKTKLDEISGTNTGNETVTSIGTLINSATAKTTPADNDMLALMDSAASNVAKKLSWANIKTALANIFTSKTDIVNDPTAGGTDVPASAESVKTVNNRVDTIITTPIDGEAAAQEIVDARGEYTTLKNRLDADDAQLAEIEQQKVGGGKLATMADMGQDVKEAMTGGSVAVVGKNTVLAENIVDNQVTPIKTSFIEAGLNKLFLNDFSYSGNGVTVTVIDNELLINGTLTANTNVVIPINSDYLVLGNTYTLSRIRTFGAGYASGDSLCDMRADNTAYAYLIALTSSVSSKSGVVSLYNDTHYLALRLTLTSGTVFTDATFNYQIEEGTVVNAYEKPRHRLKESFYVEEKEMQDYVINEIKNDGKNTKRLRIAVATDLHVGQTEESVTGYNGLARLQLFVDAINAEHHKKAIDLLLVTGDLVYHPSYTTSIHHWDDFLAYNFDMSVFIMPGNHDYMFNDEAWKALTGCPRQFSLETEEWYFICLDTYAYTDGSITDYSGIDTSFLENELIKANGKNVAICGHYFEDFSLLDSYVVNYPNIRAYLYGHSHTWYQATRPNGIVQLNSGSFADPQKSWATVGTVDNPYTNLWGFRIIETTNTELVTYQIQPAANYLAIGETSSPLSYPYTMGTELKIMDYNTKDTSHFYVPTFNSNLALSRRLQALIDSLA